MDELPAALEILADSECNLGIKVIGNRRSDNPLEFKVARYYSKYLVGPAHDDQLVSCFYPDIHTRHLDMRHKILKTYFRTGGQLELTLLNTKHEVPVPNEPAFIFYNTTENMPDVDYVIVSEKEFIDKRHQAQRYRTIKKKT